MLYNYCLFFRNLYLLTETVLRKSGIGEGRIGVSRTYTCIVLHHHSYILKLLNRIFFLTTPVVEKRNFIYSELEKSFLTSCYN